MILLQLPIRASEPLSLSSPAPHPLWRPLAKENVLSGTWRAPEHLLSVAVSLVAPVSRKEADLSWRTLNSALALAPRARALRADVGCAPWAPALGLRKSWQILANPELGLCFPVRCLQENCLQHFQV